MLKLIHLLLQTAVNVFTLWVIYVKQPDWLLKLLTILGFEDVVIQHGVLAYFALFLSGVAMISLKWLLFDIVFKPVIVEVNFHHPDSRFSNRELTMEFSKNVTMDKPHPVRIAILISGGNRLTNILLRKLGYDIRLLFKPNQYSTEITNGWASRNLSSDFIYKNSRRNICIYWTHFLENYGRIEDPIPHNPEIKVNPRRFDMPKGILDAEIAHSEHTEMNRNTRLITFIAYVAKYFMIRFKANPIQLTYKER